MKKKKLITAEKIFYNGIFYSMNETQQVWEAVAVKGQYILCVGTREEVFSWRDEHTEIIDLGGKVVIPGLIEGHLHLMQAGEVAAQVPCFWLPKDVILANVAARVRTLKQDSGLRVYLAGTMKYGKILLIPARKSWMQLHRKIQYHWEDATDI